MNKCGGLGWWMNHWEKELVEVTLDNKDLETVSSLVLPSPLLIRYLNRVTDLILIFGISLIIPQYD